MTIRFISDLHLTPQRPSMIEAFAAFLEQARDNTTALYILGDLFEYWIGDDAVDRLGQRPVLDAMRQFSDAGIPLYVMRGNRDFLLGETFATTIGAALLEEPTLIDLWGESTLLMHGDSLCTDDVAHQEFRALVRSSQWQETFLARSLDDRERTAVSVRTQSEQAKQHKGMAIMDVNTAAVMDVMREHNVRLLIHGHTHRPAIHELSLDGCRAHRVVLGDWYEHASVLTATPEGLHLTPGDLGVPLRPQTTANSVARA